MPLLASVGHGWSQAVNAVQARVGRSPKVERGQQLTMLDKKGEPNALAWAESITPNIADVPSMDDASDSIPMQPGLPPGVFARPGISSPASDVSEANDVAETEPAPQTTGEATGGEGPDSQVSASVLSDADDAEELHNPVGVTKVMGTRPRVKTMVEAIPEDSSAPGVSSDLLPDYLQDVFQKKVIVDPRVQAFLARHGTVDIHELIRDLNGFAEEIGAR